MTLMNFGMISFRGRSKFNATPRWATGGDFLIGVCFVTVKRARMYTPLLNRPRNRAIQLWHWRDNNT